MAGWHQAVTTCLFSRNPHQRARSHLDTFWRKAFRQHFAPALPPPPAALCICDQHSKTTFLHLGAGKTKHSYCIPHDSLSRNKDRFKLRLVRHARACLLTNGFVLYAPPPQTLVLNSFFYLHKSSRTSARARRIAMPQQPEMLPEAVLIPCVLTLTVQMIE